MKASLRIEQVICTHPKLNAANALLTSEYRQNLGELSSVSVGLLRADQVQWLAWMQEICQVEQPDGRAARTAQCMLPLYAERIKSLRVAVMTVRGIRFLTRTQYLANGEATLPSGMPERPGILQASWPVADSTDLKWIAWNVAMEEAAFRSASRSIGVQEDVSTAPAWNTDLAGQQDTSLSVHFRYMEHNRVTSSLNLRSLRHGAVRPTEIYLTVTWLLDAERKLSTGDIFQPGDAWRQIVAEKCFQQLKQSSRRNDRSDPYRFITGPESKPLLKILDNMGNWTLEQDGLHISYPSDDASPDMPAPDDAVLSWVELKPLLAQDFVIP